MIIFNENELKTYLKKKTGYEVASIYAIDNNPIPIDIDIKLYGNEATMKVAAFCDATKTTGFKDYTIKTFLWSETVYFTDFIKFLRLKKLHKINKSIQKTI